MATLSQELVKRGKEQIYEETSIQHKGLPTPESFTSKRTIVFDSMMCVVSIVSPSVGIGLSVGKILATLNNNRKAQRLEMVLRG